MLITLYRNGGQLVFRLCVFTIREGNFQSLSIFMSIASCEKSLQRGSHYSVGHPWRVEDRCGNYFPRSLVNPAMTSGGWPITSFARLSNSSPPTGFASQPFLASSSINSGSLNIRA
jgi:hypothetical protein